MSSLSLSVVIPPSKEAELTKEWCEKELKNIDHEILICDWEVGMCAAQAEFICLLEADCVFSKGYFKKLLAGFSNKPSYRKLAMVTPALGLNAWEARVYGYLITTTSVMPSRIKSSRDTYLIQMGFLPGAIIRRSSLPIVPITADILTASMDMSIFFWNHGQRVALNPEVTYVTTNQQYGIARMIADLAESEMTNTRELWKRELVG